ncbi:MAG: phosphodiester glycosidase family protein [Bacilli bacterium]
MNDNNIYNEFDYDNIKTKEKRPEKKKSKKLLITFVILDFLAILTLFLFYGPISYFKNLLVTTSMTTMEHKFLARAIYSEDTIMEVLNNNYVLEINEPTKVDDIIFKSVPETDRYESIYEEQILKKDNKNDLYKVIDIEGKGYKGFLVAIYDASKVSLYSFRASKGDLLSNVIEKTKALVGMNASGFYYPDGVMKPTGLVIQNSKVLSAGKSTNRIGGLIGFNYDNVLVLSKDKSSKVIKTFRDAVEFGPFLIVNGQASEIKGDGGWGIAPRTAIGQRKDGIVLFLVIDGRNVGYSLGANMKEMQKIFLRYKAHNAANLDGGGSSSLVIEGELHSNPAGNSYKGERYIPNAWILK